MTVTTDETSEAARPSLVGLGRRLGASRGPWLMFAARRLARFGVSLFILTTAAFLIIHLVPGDPVRAALGDMAPADLVEARRESLGLNDPILVHYVNYLRNLLAGDLGISMVSGLRVSDIVADRLPASFLLGALAFAAVMIVAIPTGLAMALATRGGRRRGLEFGFTSTSAFTVAIPDFVFSVLLVFMFGVTLAWLPVAGRAGPESYVLPVIALMVGPALALARIIRVEALRVIGEDYIRTARAKRLTGPRIFLRHVFPNAMTSTLTIGGLLFAGLITGTVYIETVFAWPGLGTTITSAILAKDYPLVQGIVLVYGVAVLVTNLVVDMLLAVVDPRSTIRES